jgi:hypothetical protein
MRERLRMVASGPPAASNEGAAIVELERGQVKDIHQDSTALGALLVTGVEPEATPAA